MTFPPIKDPSVISKDTIMTLKNPSSIKTAFHGVLLNLAMVAIAFAAGVAIGYGHHAKNVTELCNKIEAFTTPYGSFSCYPYEKQEKEEEEVILEKKGAK